MTAPSYEVQNIPVNDIFVVRERRPVDDEAVTRLMESIKSIQLRTPITVRVQDVTDPDTGEMLTAYGLVAGAHRLEAFRRLGETRIPAIVRDCDETDAEMWEIAENLHRAGLTKEQRDEQIRRFAELLEKKAKIQVVQIDPPEIGYKRPPPQTKGVAAQIAQQTGLSKKTVQRALNGPGAPPKIKIADAPLNDEAAQERQVAALMSAWNRASAEARQEFLARIEVPVFDRSAA